MPARRTDPAPLETGPPDGGPPGVRERILDATESCLRRDGIRRTTVAAVAAEAGISRAYVYRFFPDKPTLVSAALIRRDEAFWADADQRVSAAPTLAAMVAEAVLLSREAPVGPLAMQLAEAEPVDYAAVMGTYVHEIVPGLSDFWVDQLRRARDRGVIRDDVDVDAAADWVIRALVSLVGIPSRAVDADDRASLIGFLDTFLTPAFRVGEPVDGAGGGGR
ncbi:TetR/AcrR family transcriptional regulator [Dermatobacter hominis]|uniref:TetR/AcrR family transcriptional regulator n=1 Tax=Dermatobacter hominis TaxID=2884263 RepID=UPI001D10436D|nr:TetR/AcrR family transcriptional regulator [Dermatobacter hominis]UDY35185.1 TetR/AcrR family transcriptional regulator [Dermatobacter hominis]